MAEDRGHEAKFVLLLHGTTTGPAHGLVRNTEMNVFMSWLKLNRECDPMRGVDRTVVCQRNMNPESSKTVSRPDCRSRYGRQTRMSTKQKTGWPRSSSGP